MYRRPHLIAYSLKTGTLGQTDSLPIRFLSICLYYLHYINYNHRRAFRKIRIVFLLFAHLLIPVLLSVFLVTFIHRASNRESDLRCSRNYLKLTKTHVSLGVYVSSVNKSFGKT